MSEGLMWSVKGARSSGCASFSFLPESRRPCAALQLLEFSASALERKEFTMEDPATQEEASIAELRRQSTSEVGGGYITGAI